MKKRVRVLIVEDDESVAALMKELLGQAGCDAKIASTRPAAIRMARSRGFDLITLDVNLDGANGFDICKELKRDPQLHEKPIVMVSGEASLEDQRRGFEAGAVDYIIKPFEAFEFAPRLLSHVKRAPFGTES